eukprot:CAMPEP_0181190540 /NCGR_PEP_ID=MMETSP1096-20121128/12248_1 /TAXON_ID=156174 ORGANISM="Chrysochromulina ericina, Strain CCMP281" /NCGR_SAMPLE_ID=MMETSP1096 /ASSEMBLY_ACC=CAM_ASM_000453 /LENGTH=44 /DNA_ID= /DNA_START= /DNA_END= /DNA_ORIENTATION=
MGSWAWMHEAVMTSGVQTPTAPLAVACELVVGAASAPHVHQGVR